MLEVWTSRLRHHSIPGYRGPDALDITRSHNSIFAPSSELLREANKLKESAGDDPEALRALMEFYKPRYVEEMRVCYRLHRPEWDSLLARPVVTLCCFCRRPEFCHRILLATILIQCGAVYRGEREL